MLLVAERTSLREPTTFRDVVTSCREAGRVVREAANHYRDLQVFIVVVFYVRRNERVVF